MNLGADLLNAINEAVTSTAFSIWFLIGAALVFFMQAGFAMVETGFTRAKNAGNIIMKNLMDFCIGTVVFIFIGFSLLCGEDALGGFLGLPTLGIMTDFGTFIEENASSFVFNLVFCATAATIVSGAMAERTKFISYCIYSAIISAVVYPIEAHWIWGGGWLSQIGFHDYAGSCAIHMVGGVSAFIGAMILGPRIGKYIKDKNGKVKVKAIPGHNITIGALGCFILWFGWYGFNGAAATSVSELGSIFLTTTIAPAVATVACMIYTWIKNGKPDVSMCLNASLAGLVGVTAGCDAVDAMGSLIIGLGSGILVVAAVEFIDMKLHVDDPVGAVAVHCVNGIWGTLAVGLLANPAAPAGLNGLFYTGDPTLFGIQALGVLAVAAWTIVTMTIVFLVIKKTIGLRASAEEEIRGLDVTEHGLPSAYADFVPAVDTTYVDVKMPTGTTPIDDAVPVQVVQSKEPIASDTKISKVTIVAKQSKFDELKNALAEIGVSGMTVTNVMGCGAQKGAPEYYRGVELDMTLLPKIKIDIVVCKVPVSAVVKAAKKALYTGHIGDGKIFVYDVENVIKVRTNEEGYDALQDD